MLVAWIALVALLAAEVAASLLHWGHATPAIAVAMIAIVLVTAMRLPRGSHLSRLFALAGLVWLLVLLGLGSMDSFTRTDVPVPRLTPPGRPP